jgi:hypothetical protein
MDLGLCADGCVANLGSPLSGRFSVLHRVLGRMSGEESGLPVVMGDVRGHPVQFGATHAAERANDCG